mmetsp:Transcript_49692/g.118256  ORF Transcript_49692/g.118256 Transcript_49692/m.118256 type:complete len:383 (+) Transcript_49692:182-1330(+)
MLGGVVGARFLEVLRPPLAELPDRAEILLVHLVLVVGVVFHRAVVWLPDLDLLLVPVCVQDRPLLPRAPVYLRGRRRPDTHVVPGGLLQLQLLVPLLDLHTLEADHVPDHPEAREGCRVVEQAHCDPLGAGLVGDGERDDAVGAPRRPRVREVCHHPPHVDLAVLVVFQRADLGVLLRLLALRGGGGAPPRGGLALLAGLEAVEHARRVFRGEGVHVCVGHRHVPHLPVAPHHDALVLGRVLTLRVLQLEPKRLVVREGLALHIVPLRRDFLERLEHDLVPPRREVAHARPLPDQLHRQLPAVVEPPRLLPLRDFHMVHVQLLVPLWQGDNVLDDRSELSAMRCERPTSRRRAALAGCAATGTRRTALARPSRTAGSLPFPE